jgi:hypothetical protein
MLLLAGKSGNILDRPNSPQAFLEPAIAKTAMDSTRRA